MTAVTLGDRVAARRVSVDPLRLLLSFLAALPFVVGFVVGAVWSAVLWVCAAVAVGFDAGRGRPGDRS
jgi:uncharacterized membrane protein YciS (DUF1049 family)